MTRWQGYASWFCCYPDPCGCDSGCCQGSDCTHPLCDQTTHGTGACCTCNGNFLHFAWKYGCGFCSCTNFEPPLEPIPCGNTAWVGRQNGTNPPPFWFQGTRVDLGPLACLPIIDLTQPFFT